MTVRSLKRKGNNVLVDFNNDKALIVPYDVFLKNYLSVEDELSDQQFHELELSSTIYRIKQSSFRYLSGRNHSKYELKIKLSKKKYDSELIDEVLDDLERQNLLDDQTFAIDFLRVQLNKNKGILKIKSELFKRGVSREIIDSVSLNHYSDDIAKHNAFKLAIKKTEQLSRRNIESQLLKRKLYQFLASRGYTTDIIISVMKQMELEKFE